MMSRVTLLCIVAVAAAVELHSSSTQPPPNRRSHHSGSTKKRCGPKRHSSSSVEQAANDEDEHDSLLHFEEWADFNDAIARNELTGVWDKYAELRKLHMALPEVAIVRLSLQVGLACKRLWMVFAGGVWSFEITFIRGTYVCSRSWGADSPGGSRNFWVTRHRTVPVNLLTECQRKNQIWTNLC